MAIKKVPTYNIELERGIDETLELVYRDSNGALVDVSGYTGVFRMYGTGAGGRADTSIPLVFGSTDGKISCIISSSLCTFQHGEYVIDITPPGGVKERFMKGTLTVGSKWA